ncbi:MAG: IMP cyclohydrolase, partial [Dissulfuribacterales bacterium]
MLTPIKRALISVTDKNGIDKLAKELSEMGVEIVST